MKVIAIFLVAVVLTAQAISFTDLVVEEWNTFKAQHKKEYESDIEEKFRMRIFMENKLMIVKHNAKYEMGIVSYKLEINEFADMLHHEFINIMNGFNDTNPGQLQSDETLDGAEFIEPANVELPKTVDWREKGAVTPVKNQKRCGSCWSFSATGSLEGQHFRKTGVLTSLSEQNLIDCSSKYGNHGCRGGSTKSAFKYIRDNKGLDTENSYPYEGQDDVCRYDPSHIGAKDVGFVGISRGNENKLKSAVATVGPISVSIDAHRRTFQFYSKGVYYDPECSSTKLNHAVLAVGYGTDEKGQDYWLVKNSWGKGWGDQGYIKMARNKKNHCGIATRASYPLV